MNTLRGWPSVLALLAAAVLLTAEPGRANPGFIPSSRINCDGNPEDVPDSAPVVQANSGKNRVTKSTSNSSLKTKQVLRVTVWRSDITGASKSATCTIYKVLPSGLLAVLSPKEAAKLYVSEGKKPAVGGVFSKDFVDIVERGAPAGRYVLVVRQEDKSATGCFEFEID